MRRIVDSRGADLSGYEPVESGGGASAVIHATPAPDQSASPFMVSSLPTIAAGQDQLARQFYGRSVMPRMRIFQI